MFNMHIFSSSTRNQHPNHGLVPGAEKLRKRKKKAPATATSSSTNQLLYKKPAPQPRCGRRSGEAPEEEEGDSYLPTSSENQMYCCGRPTNAGLEYLDVNKKKHVVEVKVVTILGKVLDDIMEKLLKMLFRWS